MYEEDYKPTLWYQETIDTTLKATEPFPDQLLIELKDEAKKCYDSEVANYNIKNSRNNSDHKWIKTVMSKGVVSDKIAACVIAIQNSPLHSWATLSNLVGMVKVSKKKESIIVIDGLVELFLESLLPTTRKLIPFRQRPLQELTELSSGNAMTRKKYLTHWYFEDQLKELYTSFVLALNVFAQDTVDNNKEKAVSAMYKLLAGNAEQEKNLLSYIVNKVGDPSKKVASKTIYCLSKLLHEHSNMQGVVLNEIERLLYRPNISPRAQYYALCFLSQFYLNHDDPAIAVSLIDVYFSFFKACIKKGEVNSRTMSALLMGVNRAFPYAKLDIEKLSENINTIYRVVHVANFNISMHALMLLFHVSDQSGDISDRFYSALYRKLLDPQLASTTHHAMLLNLLYKAFVKDTSLNRIKVIIKRLLQVAANIQASVACGILYVVSQVINRNRDVMASLILKEEAGFGEDRGDDEDEKYYDVKDQDDINENVGEEKPVSTPGWVHSTTKINTHKMEIKYDGQNRNPLYAGGQFCAYTELLVLRQHYHPTVSLFANNLLNSECIKYSGDSLKDFSLIRFLDRFVYKNPKKSEVATNIGHHPTFGKRKSYTPGGARSLAVKSASYLNKQQKNIPADEQFLHMYLKAKTEERARRDTGDDESDLESVNSEEFEDMLDKMGNLDKVDEELDFMDAVGNNLKKNKNKLELKENEDDEEDNDEEEEFQLDDDFDDNESDIVFDSDDDEDNVNNKKDKKNKKMKTKIDSLFASADEFAAILDDEGSSKVKPGGANAVSNKDNANLKQIAWEEKRNQWIKGYNNIVNNKKGKFENKRKKPQQSTNNKKKKVK